MADMGDILHVRIVLGPITVPENKYFHLDPSFWKMAAFQGAAVRRSRPSSSAIPQSSAVINCIEGIKLQALPLWLWGNLYDAAPENDGF